MDCSLPGSSVPGIFWARTLGWAAISFYKGFYWPRDQNRGSCIGRWILYLGRWILAPRGKPLTRAVVQIQEEGIQQDDLWIGLGQKQSDRVEIMWRLFVATPNNESAWESLGFFFSGTREHLGPLDLSWWVICIIIVVQLLTHVWLFVTPWAAACQASLSFPISWSLLKLMSIESVMPSNHLILCHPFLLRLCFPASGFFSVSWLFTSGGQRIGASASASVIPVNIQGWFQSI